MSSSKLSPCDDLPTFYLPSRQSKLSSHARQTSDIDQLMRIPPEEAQRMIDRLVHHSFFTHLEGIGILKAEDIIEVRASRKNPRNYFFYERNRVKIPTVQYQTDAEKVMVTKSRYREGVPWDPHQLETKPFWSQVSLGLPMKPESKDAEMVYTRLRDCYRDLGYDAGKVGQLREIYSCDTQAGLYLVKKRKAGDPGQAEYIWFDSRGGEIWSRIPKLQLPVDDGQSSNESSDIGRASGPCQIESKRNGWLSGWILGSIWKWMKAGER
ncbi:hypothetical protein BJ508DRAFT_311841 [Ascobolus immersus RN42]|uniref:Uncharacterized protein n=1 Tax=Ascobolus immersus RN42 TaxID=1160509 RepID=A0A3N4HSR7_ASCIM|nr:hypothetical protein BJ508DRAFT_311841 [Ascobolus immersus RN42]